MDGHSLRTLAKTGHGGRAVTFSEHDFGNPITPSARQAALGLEAHETNFAVLRTKTHRLVQFAAGLPQILFDMTAEGEARDIAETDGAGGILLDLSVKMLCLRMQNPEGTFARTMVTEVGVQTGPDKRTG